MLSNLGITPRNVSFEPTQTFFRKVGAIPKCCQNNNSRRCHLQPFFFGRYSNLGSRVLGTLDRLRKGAILSSSCCHAVSQHFDFLNRRIFVQRIRQTFWVSCRNFSEFHSCILEISPFFAKVCIFW